MMVATLAPRARRLSNYAVTLAAGLGQILASIYLSRQAFHYFVNQDLKIWFLMLAAMPFLSLFELGATVVLPHKLAEIHYEPQGMARVASNFVATVCLVIVTVLLVGTAALWACATNSILTVHAAILLEALGIGSAIRILANVFHGLLYAQGDNQYDKSLRVVSTIVMAVTITIGLHANLSLWAMPIGWAFSGLTSICMCLMRQYRRWNVGLTPRYIAGAQVIATSKEALRYVLIALPGQLVFNATPFIIASRLPAEYTVAFGLTQQLIAGIALIANLPITVTAPVLASMYQHDKLSAREMLLITMSNVAIIAGAALCLVAMSVDTITSLWTGRHVAIGPVFLASYFFVMFVEWQQTVATTATMATGNFRFVTVTVASAALVLLLMPQLIGFTGFIGVPLALFIAQSLTCHPHNFWKAFRTFHVELIQYAKSLALPAAIVFAVLGAGVVVQKLPINAVTQLIMLSVITAMVSAVGLYTNTRQLQYLSVNRK
jgi:O-antigen/teichoic acid export membrane protein